ncbi:hypothetical protein CPC08DRAFT_764143 [Agrocybe pediades]|nr:hypothetical protein CPC08DRAFT_764143 [Agrocybe pediades]
MSAEETTRTETNVDVAEPPKSPTGPVQAANDTKKRPRLNLDASAAGGRERRKGRSMFGVLVGTLNKAKIEDKERNASEAAKKRQLIEQRLQAKLQRETDSVRRAEDAKKDKTTANRKEEDLQLKDSIYKLRRTRLPQLANFLLTSDVIGSDDPSTNPLAPVPRSHPPPLYYLPAILTPEQEAFISKRKAEVAEAAEREWQLFKEERAAGLEEINQLRQKVADEDARQKNEKAKDDMDTDAPPQSADDKNGNKDAAMEVDDSSPAKKEESEAPASVTVKKEEPVSTPADDDDAVEY